MFGGSMVAMVTPMKRDGRLDYEALERLVAFHAENGTQAIVAVGTTGESPTLSTREHAEYLERVIALSDGRMPVIAGTGSNATAQSLALTRHAAEQGADACLLVVPYYNKPTQEGLYQHFRHIAEAVDVPQILYNVPGRTVTDLEPETVGRLAELPNIIGIKEATGDISRVARLRELCGPDFELYSGEDPSAMEFMLAGGHGVITVTGNVAPRLMREMCAAAIAGDRERAEALNAELEPLHQAMFAETNPAPAKWALAEMGYLEGGIRLPLVPLSQAARGPVRRALADAGLVAAEAD